MTPRVEIGRVAGSRSGAPVAGRVLVTRDTEGFAVAQRACPTNALCRDVMRVPLTLRQSCVASGAMTAHLSRAFALASHPLPRLILNVLRGVTSRVTFPIPMRGNETASGSTHDLDRWARGAGDGIGAGGLGRSHRRDTPL